MDDRALADRLLNYADALAALSFVGMSGLTIALAEPDVRCSIVRAFSPVAISNLVTAGVLTGLLLLLRRWELDLRSDGSSSAKAQRYERRLHVARLIVVWFSAVASVLTLFVASGDPNCAS